GFPEPWRVQIPAPPPRLGDGRGETLWALRPSGDDDETRISRHASVAHKLCLIPALKWSRLNHGAAAFGGQFDDVGWLLIRIDPELQAPQPFPGRFGRANRRPISISAN